MASPDPRFGPDARPAAVTDVETAVFEGEAVVFHAPTRTVHRLGAVAGAVWMCCDGETTLAGMTAELAEAFGADPGDMSVQVGEALEHLAAEGLLQGTTGPQRLILQRDHGLTADGTPLLTPPETSADASAEPVVGSIAVRLRRHDPIVVVIGFLDDAGLAIGHELFADWVDPTVDPVALRPSFVVATGSRARGVRVLPQIRFGSIAMARCPGVAGSFQALAHILGGIERPPHEAGLTQLALRPFARGDDVVLLLADRPTMVNDRMFGRDGIVELPVWTIGLDATGAISAPAPLCGLRWSAVGFAPAAPWAGPRRLRGIVLFGQDSPADALTALAELTGSADWFRLLDATSRRGDIRVAGSPTALRVATRGLLEL